MKPQLPEIVERGRVTSGLLQSRPEFGFNGAFIIQVPNGIELQVIASTGGGWDHVSVAPRFKKRCPTWEEMCFIKSLFWDPEEAVVQYHPPRSRYINNHEFVLHLWKPQDIEIPTPPGWMVGLEPRDRHAKG